MSMFALIVAWAVMFELGVRIEDWVRYDTPILSPYRSQAQLMVRDADGVHGRPNSRFRKWILNGEGMRGPEVSRSKRAGHVRIMTVGASETFGLYESEGREYPRQLQDSLEAQRRDGRCRCEGVAGFEVLNAALLGMSLPTVAQDVRTRLSRFNPDFIVLYPAPVQYLEDEVPTAAIPDSSSDAARPLGITDALYPRSVSRLREQLKLSLPSGVKDLLRRWDTNASRATKPDGWQFVRIPAERLQAYENDLTRAIAAIQDVGAVPFVLSHANAFSPRGAQDESQMVAWGRFYPRAAPEVILAFDDSSAVTTRNVARVAKVPFLDWHAIATGKERRLFEDFAHMTDDGAGLLAGHLAARITQWTDAASDRPESVGRVTPR